LHKSIRVCYFVFFNFIFSKGLNYSEKTQCEFHTNNGTEIKDCYLFWTYSIASYRKIGDNATEVSSLNSKKIFFLLIENSKKYFQLMDGEI